MSEGRENLFPALVQQGIDLGTVFFSKPPAEAFLYFGVEVWFSVGKILPDLVPFEFIGLFYDLVEQARLEAPYSLADDQHFIPFQIQQQE